MYFIYYIRPYMFKLVQLYAIHNHKQLCHHAMYLREAGKNGSVRLLVHPIYFLLLFSFTLLFDLLIYRVALPMNVHRMYSDKVERNIFINLYMLQLLIIQMNFSK